MLEPRRWSRAVIWIGIVQAGLSAISTAWVAYGVRIALSGLNDPWGPQLPLLTFVSVFLPFLAYAADSRRVLIRYPHSPSCAWQVTGGLIGLSLSLAALHAFVLVHVVEGSAAAGLDIFLIYLLVVPAFIVGSIGAAAGMILALLCHGLIDQ